MWPGTRNLQASELATWMPPETGMERRRLSAARDSGRHGCRTFVLKARGPRPRYPDRLLGRLPDRRAGVFLAPVELRRVLRLAPLRCRLRARAGFGAGAVGAPVPHPGEEQVARQGDEEGQG